MVGKGEHQAPEHSPAAHIRRPRLDLESHATAVGRNELGTLVAAGLGPTTRTSLDRHATYIVAAFVAGGAR